MTLIATLKLEFCVQFNEGDGWISPDEIFLSKSFPVVCGHSDAAFLDDGSGSGLLGNR